MSSGVADADVVIGIDDTDNLASRGTGWLAQQMLAELADLGLGRCSGATRHQLLVDPRIPYTSHNSDAVLAWHSAPGVTPEAIADAAGSFLEARSAEGSAPGLAVGVPARLTPEARERLAAFGRSAQSEILLQSDAWELAAATGVHLSGHGGTRDGVIGALAGVGLHLTGEDGFFLWMPGTRDLPSRIRGSELMAAIPVDAALDPDGRSPGPDDVVELGDWVRPVFRGRRAVLLLDRPVVDDDHHRIWRTSPRSIVRGH